MVVWPVTWHAIFFSWKPRWELQVGWKFYRWSSWLRNSGWRVSELDMKKQISNDLLIRRSSYRSRARYPPKKKRLSAINSRISIFSKNPNIPRKEHTLGHPQTPQMKGIPKHRLLVWGLGSVPGVCWKFLTFLVRLSMCMVSLYIKQRRSQSQ